jgi:hypothetical protein
MSRSAIRAHRKPPNLRLRGTDFFWVEQKIKAVGTNQHSMVQKRSQGAVERALGFSELFEFLQIMINADQKMGEGHPALPPPRPAK